MPDLMSKGNSASNAGDALCKIANEAYDEWDAGNDPRVGKLLRALAEPSFAKDYRADIAALHDRLAAIQSAQTDYEAAERKHLDDPEELTGAADEIERLRTVADAAATYYEHYMQDEADGEACVCGREQQERAAAVRDALRALPPNDGAKAPERSDGRA
jgi:hypothetical protein